MNAGPRLRRDGGSLLLLLALWLLFVWPYFTPSEADRGSIRPGDVDTQFYQLARSAATRLAVSELPLWNPATYGGSPFVAEPQAALLYPPRWLTLLGAVAAGGPEPLPFVWFELEVLGHLLLAALLAYGLFRTLTGRSDAAVAGAITFSFSSYLTGYPLEQVAIVSSAAWLPALFWGIELGVRGRRRGGWMTTGALAMCFLAGNPQIALYGAYASLAYLAVRGRQRGWSWNRLGGVTAAAGGVVALLTMAQWLPTAEFLRLTPRAALSFDAVASGLNPRDLIEIILPRATTRFASLYLGLLPLALVPVALRSRRPDDGTLFWPGLAGAALLFSFGRHTAAFGWAYLLLPGFALFRQQERIIVLWALAAAALVAYGVAALRSRPAPTNGLPRLWGRMAVGLAFFTLAAYLLDNPVQPALAYAALLSAAIAILLAAVPRYGGVPAFLLPLLILLCLDLFTINGRAAWEPIAPEIHQQPAPLLASLAPDAEVALLDIETSDGVLNPGPRPLPATTGASQLRLERWERAAQLPRDRWWQLWGVSHVATWRHSLPLPATILAERSVDGESERLFLLDQPAGRAHLLFRVETMPDEETLWSQLADPAHDPARVMLLEAPPSSVVDGGVGQVNQVRVGPESWEVQVETSAPAFLRLALPYYPGWRATVDGRPVELYRSDGLWSGVLVPEGRHLVRMAFIPLRWGAAAAISLLAWLLWLGSAFWFARSGHRASSGGS